MCLQDGWSALMVASENGHTEVVKCLIEANLAVDLQSKKFCKKKKILFKTSLQS